MRLNQVSNKDKKERILDELNRAQATREAVQAQLNPEMYRNSKLGEVDRAIEYGLSNLSPQDRAIAEQEIATNYNKNARTVCIRQSQN